MKKPTTIRLDDSAFELMETIKKEYGLRSNNAAIEFALNMAANKKTDDKLSHDLSHSLFLIKKYLNELRRDSYRELSYLDTIALQMNIATVLPWHEKTVFTPAHISVNKNLKEYLDEISTKNMNSKPSTGEINE